MKNFKKVIALALALVMTAAVLAGCGKKDSQEEGKTDTSDFKVGVYHNGGGCSSSVINQMFTAFAFFFHIFPYRNMRQNWTK